MVNHIRGLMHVKYTLLLCQNVAFMPIISIIFFCIFHLEVLYDMFLQYYTIQICLIICGRLDSNSYITIS